MQKIKLNFLKIIYSSTLQNLKDNQKKRNGNEKLWVKNEKVKKKRKE